ncbi:hypothetical protein PVT67_16240 [Gallaecimonas kandeliae]|uniref:hypothetical protein n=1 Tax=Gallaecimonas kandeliae TaxID=3029055 RepID=UPI00264917C5|nr:hypothetical protein [Gallaecimonas kandeliae]WKE65192.1 hypothetical protein PVT67_16240 [Gallaecimonas kandeliae]
MKASIFAVLALAAVAQANADQVTYSNSQYCAEAKAGQESRYLQAYAAKLGSTPSRHDCAVLLTQPAEVAKAQWDFQGNKPYQGSVVRLSVMTVTKLRALPAGERKQAFDEALSAF